MAYKSGRKPERGLDNDYFGRHGEQDDKDGKSGI